MRLENDTNKFRLAVTKSFKLDFAVCDDNLSRDQKKKKDLDAFVDSTHSSSSSKQK